MPTEDAIESFWSFWRENRDAITASIGERTLNDWVEPISTCVRAIEPGLDWEMGEGLDAQHYFCVSAKGDMAVRVTAERWLSRAPAANGTWEFHAARPCSADVRELDFAGVVFPVKDFRIACEPDEGRARGHVTVHHPRFADASEELQFTATFIALDHLLGEDEVERWIGAVDLSVDPLPADALSPGSFVELVDEFRGAQGELEHWATLRGTLEDGSPVFVTADLGIKRVDHLLMDQHVELEVPLEDPTDDGLTTSEEAEALNALEDRLFETLGHDAVYIGRETRQGLRVLHFHVAAGGPALGRIESWLAGTGRDVRLSARLDPTWEVLGRW